MKNKLVSWLAAVTGVLALTSCQTTYDPYGRPVQSVDPGAAVVGAAAAGLVGYAIGNNRNDDHYHFHGRRGFRGIHQPARFRGGYCPPPGVGPGFRPGFW